MFTGTNMPGVISRNQSITKLLFKMCVCSVAQLFVMSWAVALQAPLPMGFPKQEYWSAFTTLHLLLKLPFPTPGELPNPGMERGSPASPASPAWAGEFFTTVPPKSLLFNIL